ncbi:hypothetical protein PHAVU_010G121900 [Phaseolus vulgaris]
MAEFQNYRCKQKTKVPSKKKGYSSKCASLVKEQRARLYILRRCATMLLCWKLLAMHGLPAQLGSTSLWICHFSLLCSFFFYPFEISQWVFMEKGEFYGHPQCCFSTIYDVGKEFSN